MKGDAYIFNPSTLTMERVEGFGSPPEEARELYLAFMKFIMRYSKYQKEFAAFGEERMVREMVLSEEMDRELAYVVSVCQEYGRDTLDGAELCGVKMRVQGE